MAGQPLESFPPGLESPALQLEPHGFYAEKHAESPIQWDEKRESWDVYGYDAVRRIAADPERFSSRIDLDPDFEAPADGFLTGRSMLYQDPPRHDELRDVVDDFFTPGAVADLEPAIQTTAERLLDEAFAGGDRFDLVEAYTYPLPVEVIATMLGVPAADRESFREWSLFAVTTSGDDEEAVRAMRSSMFDYFDDLITAKEADPRDDLISRVLAAEGLSRDELVGFFTILLIAGNITTTNLLTSAVWTLEAAGRLDLLRDAEALPTAIEEVLRYRSPVQAHPRTATTDVTVAGADIREGDRLALWFGAANHDPTVFDAPDAFVPDRSPNRHVAFGHGVHFCLGASLARLEARVALRVLGERIENLCVDADTLAPSGSVLVYGPSRCVVTAGPRAS